MKQFRDWGVAEKQLKKRAEKRLAAKAKDEIEAIIDNHPITHLLGFPLEP